MTWPNAIPRTFNEKEHKKMYLKWVGMVNKVKTYVDLTKIEKLAKNLNSEEEGENSDEDLEIPEVPLTLQEEPEEGP